MRSRSAAGIGCRGAAAASQIAAAARSKLSTSTSGDRFVGRQHEFLDQLVAFVVFHALHPVGKSLFVDVNLNLRHIEVEAPTLKPLRAKFFGN
jgi:hypothetical protein